jgi:hypothetical protein
LTYTAALSDFFYSLGAVSSVSSPRSIVPAVGAGFGITF